MEAERRKLGCNLQLWRLIMPPDLSVMTLFIWDHFLLLHCWETSFSKHRASPFLSSCLALPTFLYLLRLYFGTVPEQRGLCGDCGALLTTSASFFSFSVCTSLFLCVWVYMNVCMYPLFLLLFSFLHSPPSSLSPDLRPFILLKRMS